MGGMLSNTAITSTNPDPVWLETSASDRYGNFRQHSPSLSTRVRGGDNQGVTTPSYVSSHKIIFSHHKYDSDTT